MRKTAMNVEPGFYSRKTETGLTVVMPVKTEKIPTVDKTAQFVNMVNLIIRNGFAIVTIELGPYGYRVMELKQAGNNKLRVYFLDFEGKGWSIEVGSWHSFNIFRGLYHGRQEIYTSNVGYSLHRGKTY